MGSLRIYNFSRVYALFKEYFVTVLGNMSNPEIINGKLYGQDFQKIKAQCIKNGTLFQDEKFPATNRSLYFEPEKIHKSWWNLIQWQRPKEIVDEPHFFVDGINKNDINQGHLGCCWFMAGFSSLMGPGRSGLINEVIPPGQTFTENCAGIFRFRFWQYGQWIDVVVDDHLPLKNGKLYFVKSDTFDEFWIALLQKAYAKLHGSYENIEAGHIADAMVDFTGGISRVFNIVGNSSSELFAKMLQFYKTNSSLLGAGILGPNGPLSPRLSSSDLPSGHAYNITKILELRNGLKFIRIRNTSIVPDALGSFMKLEVHDKWIPGKESPQYDFTVPKIEGTNSVTVSLIQKNRRQLKDEGFENILIGFDLLLKGSTSPLTPVPSLTSNISSSYRREVVEVFNVVPGNYIIVPHRQRLDISGEFYLRIYIEKE